MPARVLSDLENPGAKRLAAPRYTGRVGADGLLLAIDIGNTNIKLGMFRGDELVQSWRLETDRQRMPDEFAAILGVLLQHAGLSFTDVGGVSISSTVPVLVATMRELAERYFRPGIPFVQVATEAKTGITIAIENPREMGADRIVDAMAAARLYRLPAIIIDFGTATTFDAVDADRRLLGTAIAPGFETSMEGLFQRAAKLSRMARVELERPRSAIGRTTVAAIRSGWIFGYVGLVEGLVGRIKRELGGEALVIGTGGLAAEVIAETSAIDIHDPELTLKGLRMFYEMNVPGIG